MNIRLLGVLLLLIGAVFGYYSMTRRDLANQQIAGLEMQDYARKTSGEVFDPGLLGVKASDLEKQRDTNQQYMTIGWVLSAIGLAIALAAKTKKAPTTD